MRRLRRAGLPRRDGTVSLLAMLYLMIFSALALGFYAQTNVSAQISENEKQTNRALVAAESGMAFMRYTLSQVETSYLPENQMLLELAYELSRLLDGSDNLVDPKLGLQEVGISDGGDAILIPKHPNAVMPLGNDMGFRVKITRAGRSFVVKVAGTSGTHRNGATVAAKGVEYVYGAQQKPAPLFEYGVAGRGQIELSGGGRIIGATNAADGTVLSTTTLNPAVVMTGPSIISGKVYLKNPSATTSYSTNSSVNGSTLASVKSASTIKITRPPGTEHLPDWPEFPKIDTSIYLPYVKRVYNPLSPPGSTLRNIRIPAGLGTLATPVKFTAGTTVEGVCYIEAPNVVYFEGACTLRGVIVGPNVPLGTLATNIVEFQGQATAYDVGTIPSVYDMTVQANKDEFPAGLLALKGSSMLTPGYHVKFTGGYAAISGSIVSDQLTFSGSAGGSITGYVIGMANQKLAVSGQGTIQLQKPPPTPWPAGVFFRHWYAPEAKTYREFRPKTEGM